MYMVLYLLFFFKKKTAYEMRISDWSSDVCSSDLERCASLPQWNAVTYQKRCIARGRRQLGFDGHRDEGRRWSPGRRYAGNYPGEVLPQIGRASCRERVCQYV